MKNNSIKILNLTTSSTRGAGMASKYLHECFIRNGLDSYLFSYEKTVVNNFKNRLSQYRKKIISDKKWFKIKNIFFPLTNNKYAIHSINDHDLKEKSDEILKTLSSMPDVVLIHWVSGFINAKTIYELYNKIHKPIYWLLMDNAPLTGGCHYPWECKGYLSCCEKCPALNSDKPEINMKDKIKFLSNIDISCICFSKSDYKRAQSSILFKNKKIYQCLLPVDATKFFPSNDRDGLRRKYNIPINKKVILVGASNVQDKRKGLDLFIEAWNKIVDKSNILLVIIGKADKECLSCFRGNLLNLGVVNEGELKECYQLSDFFVCPSVEDSGPYMINQSIMCGTPVVAFNIGVAQDLIKTGVTGYNCNDISADSLYIGLNNILALNKYAYSSLRKSTYEIALLKLKEDSFVKKIKEIISLSS